MIFFLLLYLRHISLGSPCSTITPSFNSATVSHSEAASSMLCVVRKIVHPSLFFSRIILWIAFIDIGSNPLVGSSRKIISGECMKTRASRSLAPMPFDKCDAGLLTASLRLTYSKAFLLCRGKYHRYLHRFLNYQYRKAFHIRQIVPS